MAGVLMLSFTGLMLIGLPIAFAMALAAIVTIANHPSLPYSVFVQRALIGADSYSLLAIPFFILAGNIMNVGGITVRIISFANACVGRFSGGLGLTTVMSCMVFSGVSGSAVADATALGKVLIPGMKRSGYAPGLAAAITASASVMGPIIPPSIPLVIYALSVGKGVSVAALFLGGVVPGLLLGAGLAVAVYFVARARRYPVHEAVPMRQLMSAGVKAIWALMMPFVILFGVTGGIVTVTESAAIAVLYALFVSMVVHRELSWRQLWGICVQSGLDSAVVMIIIAFAAGFGWLMAISGLPRQIATAIAAISDNPLVILLLINLLLLVVGCFMEAIAAMIILVPVLIPIVEAVGIDLVHFGLVLVFNLMLGLLTPPVGILLYICGNFAQVKIESVIREVLPFLAVGLAVLVVITLFPQTVLWLPNLVLN
ncbi:TRAP transporter large permease [Bosea sp. 124]|uniref:TRAP transporter large permease n=1 Tax=Bosea sp. 124 TaxID=2135642 RepID=UPI000D4DEF16|nr:TRAP transporter large permease [Bosea sp. 124]PTM40975.1 tripartite ATP-independent transporter DctM subunit [Bosea sp. 124]